MAQPSSSHRDRDVDRSERRSSSRRTHKHRSISSTTLLLVLSLVLAVLAIMLAFPTNAALSGLANGTPPDPNTPQGVWGILTPKRSQALVSRESSVAHREAEVARREAELLVGAPGGVVQTSPTACPVCPTIVDVPVQTVIKEVVHEPPTSDVAPSGWYKEAAVRMDDILDRELKIADRERELARREETVNRREHDASRRESWIMEQLVTLGNEGGDLVEEEYVYDGPARRYPKQIPPPLIVTETAIAFETQTVTHTQHHTYTTSTRVTVPQPANTRLAASPSPVVGYASVPTTHIPKTTAIEIITEEEVPEPVVVAPTSVTVHHNAPPRRAPKRWLGGW